MAPSLPTSRLGLKTVHVQSLNVLLFTIATSSCNPGSMNGETESRKSPKKAVSTQESADVDNTSEKTPDHVEPEIITGSYLGCIQDYQSGLSKSEIIVGCGIYDSQTDEKKDLAALDLKFELFSTDSVPIPFREQDLPHSKIFHRHLFISASHAQSLTVAASLSNTTSNRKVFEARKVIYLKTLQDGFDLKDETPESLTPWCGMATKIPYDAKNPQRLLIKGAACGADYLQCLGSTAPGFVDIIADFSAIFGSRNALANSGVCEKSDKTFRAAEFIKRCACPSSSKPMVQ